MEDVFAAVADDTRRRILDRLRDTGPLSIKQLSGPLPISRQAVTKHLDILEACGLIRVEWAGRERRHRLAAERLQQVENWLKPYAELWDERLGRLKSHLEEKK